MVCSPFATFLEVQGLESVGNQLHCPAIGKIVVRIMIMMIKSNNAGEEINLKKGSVVNCTCRDGIDD